uniref:NADH-ubiquinone oxidoreductase chain 6 n=1 Tax=Brontostoma colossus TaxID=1532881 RepID=A0A076L492_9HEMI|nr:NADH dehydrogenase subunit 6 [Brontostoma colossus]AIJ03001.1 NADH dehydrogenase subunit 6 [Brontostoma colossus]
MNKMLIIMSLTLSMMFMKMKHPLSMGLTLILQTLITATLIGMMSGTFWFSYILTMIMLSGMLIIFIYMASIASNEKFNTSLKLPTMMMLMFIIMPPWMSNHMEMKKYDPMFMGGELSFLGGMEKLFNMHNYMITMMMVVYLLVTMIIISNIVKINEGPLRMKN